ncbi:MAG: Flp pilus assembly protein CpaB [Actinomycetota bacterium]|nr:Flp pilus assembly protein CpaB [Actinomycetota bacterium]
MGRRTLLLLAALLIAAVGTTLVFLYANSAESRAVAQQHPVDVLVAKSDIAAGTTEADAVSKGLFLTKTITRAAAIPTALSPRNLQAIEGKVAVSTIFAGQQIVPQAFGSSAQTSGGLALPLGTMAVSVQLDDPSRVAGFVQPGSKVAIFVTVAPTNGTAVGAFTRLLLPGAQVVAVGPSTNGTTTSDGTAKTGATGTNPEQLPRAILTLALSQFDAEKVIFAQRAPGSGSNRLYFGLLNDKSTVTKTPGVDIRNLFS